MSAGTATTPRSGVVGRLSMSGYVVTPWTARYFGFTGMMGPSKPARNRLRARTEPIDPGRVLAPISAMDPGANR
jgi:hypothetical protein